MSATEFRCMPMIPEAYCLMAGSGRNDAAGQRSRDAEDRCVGPYAQVVLATAVFTSAAAAVATTAATAFTTASGMAVDVPLRSVDAALLGLNPAVGFAPQPDWADVLRYASSSSSSSASEAPQSALPQQGWRLPAVGAHSDPRVRQAPRAGAVGTETLRAGHVGLIAGALALASPFSRGSALGRRGRRRSRAAVAVKPASHVHGLSLVAATHCATESPHESSLAGASWVEPLRQRGPSHLATARFWSPLDALFGRQEKMPEADAPKKPKEAAAPPANVQDSSASSSATAAEDEFVNTVTTVHSEDELNTLLASGADTVVKLAFTWCRPCKRFWPRYQKYAKIYKNTQFLRIVGNENESCKHFARDVMKAKISPMFAAYSGGKPLGIWTGANNARFVENMQAHLSSAQALAQECQEAMEKDPDLK
eukprot:TRINITY_DN39585_c0_g1_i2.p1 TRINITY_DN39585_c0_g1~~TRINITY_DN39585_c0_g1_i2.p1  ORF type:complete len:424 (+),score=64.49 TRINITY_DN39585_c0_g1_i2:98-1369(+)